MHIIDQSNTTITLALLHICISLLKFIYFVVCIYTEDLNKHIVCSSLLGHYDLSFIARSAPMTSIGAVLPVTF